VIVSEPAEISRRTFVLGTSATVAISAAGTAAPASTTGTTAASTKAAAAVTEAETDALLDLGAVDAVAQMAHGALTAERYAQALLARCQSAHALNAFITLEPARVLEDARARDRERLAGAKPGPLFGLPIPVKDSVNTRDYPTTGGTPALRHFRPVEDAPVVGGRRAGGAHGLGTTQKHAQSNGGTPHKH
jgi:Asp-tRNA(Asn)/Glu-tRNA(Gln) amidotransferase A subunit family amidase